MAEPHSHSSSLVRKTTTKKGKEKSTSHDRQLRHFPWYSEPDRYQPLRSHQDPFKSSKARKDEQFSVIRRTERPVVPASTQLSSGLSKLEVSSCNLSQSTQDNMCESSYGKYTPLRALQDSTDISAATAGNPLAPKSTKNTVGLKYVTGEFLTKGDYNSASCLSGSSTERLSDEAYPFTTGGLNKVLKTHPVEKTPAAVSQAQVAMNYKAIPLCLPDNLQWDPRTGQIQQRRQQRRKLNVVNEAIAELQKIKDPICVLAIVGPCRDGKSFILSETFDQGDVFPVGYKIDPETMGIWMWILPHIIFVLRLSQQIKVTSQGGTQKNEDAFHKTFPHFVWLLRDVLTELPSDCKDIKDYFLRRIFKSDPWQLDHTQDKIARGILHYFSGFDAFCLPIPTCDKELLKNIKSNRHDPRINPDFFTGIQQFKDLLQSNMGPKKSFNAGENVTGEALAALTKFYVDAINDPDNIPDVQTAWDGFVKNKSRTAREKALLVYDRRMKTKLYKLPCETEKILASHESSANESMLIFEEETVGITSDNTREDCQEFMKETVKKLSEWKTKNDGLTRQQCQELLKNVREKYLNPVLRSLRGPNRTSITSRDTDNACSKIEEDYKRFAAGAKDIRADVLHEFHENLDAELTHYKEFIRAFQDYEKNLLKERRESAEKEREAEKARIEVQYLKKQQQFQEQKLSKMKMEKEREIRDKISECKAKEDILTKKIHDMETAGMEKQINTLRYQLREANSEKQQRQNEISNLTNEISRMKEELRRANRPWYKKLFGWD